MIKRKYVIFFLTVYLLITCTIYANAALLSPFISKLAPAAAAATGVAGGFTIPAKIAATTSTGAKVASWISLAVPGVTAAKVAGAVLAIGGALAADYLMAKGLLWFEANKIEKNDGTDLDMPFKKTDSVKVPNGYTAADYTGWRDNILMMGIYDSAQLAAAACNDYKATVCPTGTSGHSGVAYKGAYAYSINCGKGVSYHFYYGGGGQHFEDRTVPVTVKTVQNKLETDLAAENANAKTVAKAALEVAANAIDNPGHPVTTNTNTYNNINNYLTQNITDNQKTNLEAAATPNVGDNVLPDDDETNAEKLTPAQIAAAVQAALAGQGLSAAQIAAAVTAAQAAAAAGGLTQAQAQAAVAAAVTGAGLTPAQIAAAIAAANPALTEPAVKNAVKDALADETGVPPPPVEPTISLPEKLSLTEVLSDYMANIENLPIFNTLKGITVNVSGTSQLCLDLPAGFGGTKCFNGANFQDELNMIGSALLGLVSIISFIGIFKG